MSDKKILSLAYSSCPNDTYIFHGLVHKLVNTNDIDFDVTLADIETLNQNAQKSLFNITKLSFAAFGNLRDKYKLLRSGAALGNGCGPIVVSMPDKNLGNIKKPKIAVPGLGTTAYLLFQFFIFHCYPDAEPDIIPMKFDKIMPSVKQNKVDFGVIIHEGRFVYEQTGLQCITDLGNWWEEKTGLPIPLGCIAVRRDMDMETAFKIQSLIAESIDYALNNPLAGRQYIKTHAKELDDKVIKEHIKLYVNNFSKDIGEKGEKAIKIFLKKGEQAGLINPYGDNMFAC